MTRNRLGAAAFAVAMLLARAAAAGPLFADDVAVHVNGEFRTLYEYTVEPDGDKSQRPGTLNQVSPRLRLAPELWINEFLAVKTLIDAAGPRASWGATGGPLDFAGSAGAVDLNVGRAGLWWQTPVGTLEVGRIGWHWGLGLFDNDGRSDMDRYGVPQGTGAQDMLKIKFAPLGVDRPLKVSLFARQWFNGWLVHSGFADNAWSFGAAAEGETPLTDYGVQLRYDMHKTGTTELFWVDAFNRWRVSIVAIEAELATRWGGTRNLDTVDVAGRSRVDRRARWFGWAGVGHVTLPGWRTGKIGFGATGIEGGVFSGDDDRDVFTAATWHGLYANPDYHVGLLIFPKLWPYWRDRFRAQRLASVAGFAGTSVERLGLTHDARIGAGMGNNFFIYPGFGLQTDGDLRFRINALYARALSGVPSMQFDSRGTVQTADDVYKTNKDYGFEIDVHLSYPVWSGVAAVLESGVAFPGNVFINARGEHAPTAFLLAPRLTAEF